MTRGAQLPRLRSVPPAGTSAGSEAVDLAASAGLILDPWQALVLEDALGEDAAGNWAAFEVGLVVARQNGKGSILEARELAGLFLFGDRLILHSAHEFRTAKEAFLRIRTLIEASPELKRRVKQFRQSSEDTSVELHDGARLKFVARSGGSGRGFSADTIILDEAYNLPETAIGALLPTLSTRPNPQVWYTSSAVDQQNPAHQNGDVLTAIRHRGLAGGDTSLCYLEWSADDDRYRDERGELDRDAMNADERAWAESNPGLGIRIKSSFVEKERKALGARSFSVERLSVGDWPVNLAESHVIDPELWAMCQDDSSQPNGEIAFSLDVAPNRASATIASSGRRADGLPHVEVVDNRKGTSWVVARAAALKERWSPVAFVVNAAGPAGSLVADLEAAGVKVTNVSARDMGAACMGFEDDVKDDRLRHIGQPVLNVALSQASKRKIGNTGSWAWDRRDAASDISPLVAVTLARWGYLQAQANRPPEQSNNAFFI